MESKIPALKSIEELKNNTLLKLKVRESVSQIETSCLALNSRNTVNIKRVS